MYDCLLEIKGKAIHYLILCLVPRITGSGKTLLHICNFALQMYLNNEYAPANAIALLPKIILVASNLCRNDFEWEDI